jgi:hypothetical protein
MREKGVKKSSTIGPAINPSFLSKGGEFLLNILSILKYYLNTIEGRNFPNILCLGFRGQGIEIFDRHVYEMKVNVLIENC